MPRSSSLDKIFSVFFVMALLGFVTGGVELFSAGGLRLISAATWKVSLLICCFFYCYKLFLRMSPWARARSTELPVISPFICLVGFLLLIASDYEARKHIFYVLPDTRLCITLAGVLVLALSYLMRRREPLRKLFSIPMLFLVQITVTVAFLHYADGRLIFSDDHPSFLYRLQLLKEHFPNIPFYNAEWNAGYSAREFLPSGMLNVFFFTWPFIYKGPDIFTFDGAVLYTYLIPYVYVFVVSWGIYFASRLLGCSKEAAVIAAILAIGPSLSFFEWLLRYGTLGFVLSASFVPLTLSLINKLAFEKETPTWTCVFLLLLVSFLCISWTLCSFTLVPAALLGLFRLRSIFVNDRSAKVFAFLVLFCILNGPWLKIFFEESKVLSFVSRSSMPGVSAKKTNEMKTRKSLSRRPARVPPGILVKLKKVHKKLKSVLVKINPVILLFFVPGIAVLASPAARLLYGSTVLWLFALAAFGDLYKPQLELTRMIVPASFLMLVLAAASVAKLAEYFFDTLDDSCWSLKRFSSILSMLGLIVVFGGLVLSPITAGAVYRNHSDHSSDLFVFAPETFEKLSSAISEHGGDGRTFFSGFILHELGARAYDTQDGGHIAPIASFSNKPLYAFDFYHVYWGVVDPIPASYRKRGEAGIEEFLDLVNVTAMVTFKREWAEYCKKRPHIYTQVFKHDRFRLFVRKPPRDGYFLKGRGVVNYEKEGFSVVPKSEELVLKFRYLPKIRSSNPLVGVRPIKAFVEDVGGKGQRDVYFVGLKVPAEVVEKGEAIHLGYYQGSPLE